MLVFLTILLLRAGTQAAPQTKPGPTNTTPIPTVEKVGRNGFQQSSELGSGWKMAEVVLKQITYSWVLICPYFISLIMMFNICIWSFKCDADVDTITQPLPLPTACVFVEEEVCNIVKREICQDGTEPPPTEPPPSAACVYVDEEVCNTVKQEVCEDGIEWWDNLNIL